MKSTEPTESEGRPRQTDWRAASAESLAWADLQDGFAVYHRPSGKTHFINESTAVLLVEVLREPRALHRIVAELADSHGRAMNRAYVHGLFRLLQRLEQLGLVERVHR